ncbi:MAG: hypothetical protein HS111_22885 [Kofleriaceae bacterium]|nr:hypothetical protein [Kofleriaceae bacterium]
MTRVAALGTIGEGRSGACSTQKDKKRKDDFDSPVDRVDLSGPTPAPATSAAATAARSTPAPPRRRPRRRRPRRPPRRSPPGPRRRPRLRARVVPWRSPAGAAAPPPPEVDDYGIDKAIELMRTLPSENIELVVQVVKFSLESVGIHLPTIIKDAIRRQDDLQGRVASLRAEIADLEAEIKLRREEIARHEADHKETTMVRERLELAEKLGKGGKPGGRDEPRADKADAKADKADAKADKAEPAAGASGSGLPSLSPTRSHPVTGQTAIIPPKK